MADFSLPTTSSLYTDVISILKSRDDDLATMFQSGGTNLPTNAVRWNPTNKYFEIWSGTAWAELVPKASSQYDINVNSLGGFTASSFLRLSGAGSQTISSGVLTLASNTAAPLQLKGGTADRVYLEMFADSASQATRSAYIGFPAAGQRTLTFKNEHSGGNLNLLTTGSTFNTGVVSINGNTILDRGHGNVGVGSDIYFTASGLIAAQNDMYFNIDSDNNSTGNYFSWRHNAETNAATELMKLDDNGKLTIRALGGGDAIHITAPTTTGYNGFIVWDNGSVGNRIAIRGDNIGNLQVHNGTNYVATLTNSGSFYTGSNGGGSLGSLSTRWSNLYLTNDVNILDSNGYRSYLAPSKVEVGRNTGSVALTINDGYGNANVTFNHANGVPDIGDGTNASSCRIETSVDTPTASFSFEMADNVTAGTALSLTQVAHWTLSKLSFKKDTEVTGKLHWHSSDGRIDLNTLSGFSTLNTGVYWSGSGGSNYPTGISGGGLLHIHHDSGGNYSSQLFIDQYGNRLAFRGNTSGTWSSWRDVIHNGGGQTINGNLSITGQLTLGSNGHILTQAGTNEIQYQSASSTAAYLRLKTNDNVVRGGIVANSDNSLSLLAGSSTTPVLTVKSGSVSVTGDFTASGDVTAFSDITVKSNISKIPSALNKVMSLSGYTFDRTDINKRQTGVIAQEVLKVLPEAVVENSEGMLSVAYGNMVGLLIEAIKELNEVKQ